MERPSWSRTALGTRILLLLSMHLRATKARRPVPLRGHPMPREGEQAF